MRQEAGKPPHCGTDAWSAWGENLAQAGQLQCPPGCSPFQLEDFPGHRNVFYLQVPSLRDGPFLDSYLSPLSFLFSILFPLVLPSFMEVFLPFWESKVVDQHSVDVTCESFHLWMYF